MFWDDLRKLLGGRTLYQLDSVIAVRLVPILYAVGLAAIGLWAIDHLVASFAASFSEGLWGILEIIVFGLLDAVALRIACELVLVFFTANEASASAVDRARGRNTLAEEVRDAIHDLAEHDDDEFPAREPSPMDDAPPPEAGDVDPIIKDTVRRQRRRPPPAKT